jgi:hypothetical protein
MKPSSDIDMFATTDPLLSSRLVLSDAGKATDAGKPT